MDEYRPPALASFFRFIGALNILAALIALFSAFASLREHETFAFLAFVPFIGALISAFFCFAVAQLIDLLGQIAHNSELVRDQLEKYGKDSLAAAKAQISGIDELIVVIKRGQAASTGAAKPTPTAPASVSGASAARFYYLDRDSQAAGPVTRAELKSLVQDGSAGRDSLVCPEGSDQWKQLQEFDPF